MNYPQAEAPVFLPGIGFFWFNFLGWLVVVFPYSSGFLFCIGEPRQESEVGYATAPQTPGDVKVVAKEREPLLRPPNPLFGIHAILALSFGYVMLSLPVLDLYLLTGGLKRSGGALRRWRKKMCLATNLTSGSDT